jgi:hypothetical protein
MARAIPLGHYSQYLPRVQCPIYIRASSMYKRLRFIKAKKLDQQFDEGVGMKASLDLSKSKRVLRAQNTQSRSQLLNG